MLTNMAGHHGRTAEMLRGCEDAWRLIFDRVWPAVATAAHL